MDVLYARCAGLDVHKRTVVACVRRVDPAGKVAKAVKTFATMTADLLGLADWLAVQGVEAVAMESTGSYWTPVFNLLEAGLAVVLVNAHHIKQVPGRKTDVRDSEWLAQLLQHGLLRPSFIPPRPNRELRDLTCRRTQLSDERTAVINRIQKVLEDANIKLGSVASNALGVSGRLMIAAIIRGEYDPVKPAGLARGRLRKKVLQLRRALRGGVTGHHRFLRGPRWTTWCG
jgi:transposase